MFYVLYSSCMYLPYLIFIFYKFYMLHALLNPAMLSFQSLASNTPLHLPIQYGNNHAPGSLSVKPVPPGGPTTYGLAFQRYCLRSLTGNGGRLLRLSMCGTLNRVWVLSYTTSFLLELSLGQSIKSWLHVCKFHNRLLRISGFTARWSTASTDA